MNDVVIFPSWDGIKLISLSQKFDLATQKNIVWEFSWNHFPKKTSLPFLWPSAPFQVLEMCINWENEQMGTHKTKWYIIHESTVNM